VFTTGKTAGRITSAGSGTGTYGTGGGMGDPSPGADAAELPKALVAITVAKN
jgi:hypothetical protein